MTAAVVGPLAAGTPARYAALAAALAVVVGGLCLLARLARLGVLAELLSKPVLVGYLAGIAVLMIVSQLGKVTGVPVTARASLAQLTSFLRSLDRIQPATRRCSRPRSWSSSSSSTGASRGHRPADRDARRGRRRRRAVARRTTGCGSWAPSRAGLPHVAVPAVAARRPVPPAAPGLGVMIVGVHRQRAHRPGLRGRNGYRIDANQELLALGVANLAAGCIQGFPVSSSGSRTARRRRAGQPDPAALPGRAGLGGAGPALPPARCWPTSRPPRSARSSSTRPLRLIDLARVPAVRRASGAASCCWRWPPPSACSCSASLRGAGRGRRCPSPTCCAGSRARTTASSATSAGWPACTTSTTTRTRDGARPRRLPLRLPAVLRQRRGLPARRARAAVERAARRPSGSCSTPRPTSRSTSPRSTRWRSCAPSWSGGASSSRMARVKQDLLVRLEASGLAERVGADRIFPTLPTAVEGYLKWYEAQHGRRPAGW